jgi:hypothetical protein
MDLEMIDTRFLVSLINASGFTFTLIWTMISIGSPHLSYNYVVMRTLIVVVALYSVSFYSPSHGFKCFGHLEDATWLEAWSRPHSMANLITLLSRIQGSGQSDDSVPDIGGEHLWLEAFLDRWVSAEDEFFSIALEKEERDAYVYSFCYGVSSK